MPDTCRYCSQPVPAGEDHGRPDPEPGQSGRVCYPCARRWIREWEKLRLDAKEDDGK